MKRIKLLLSLLLSVAALSGNAQLVNALTKAETSEDTQKEASKDNFTPGWHKSASSFSFNYMGRFEKGAAVNYDMRFSMINLGGSYTVSGGNGWNVYAGVAQRYYFNRNIYVDGAIGGIYSHSSYEYKKYVGQETYYIFNKPYTRDKYEYVKESAGAFGLYVLPRIGLVTGKGWGINIGYMMGAPKFKFDGFFDNGTVMLGLVFGA